MVDSSNDGERSKKMMNVDIYEEEENEDHNKPIKFELRGKHLY